MGTELLLAYSSNCQEEFKVSNFPALYARNVYWPYLQRENERYGNENILLSELNWKLDSPYFVSPTDIASFILMD